MSIILQTDTHRRIKPNGLLSEKKTYRQEIKKEEETVNVSFNSVNFKISQN